MMEAVLAALCGFCVVGFVLARRPETATVAFAALLYANAAALAGRATGASQAVGGALFGLLALPVVGALWLRRQPARFDTVWIWMLAFLGATVVSTFAARDPALAGQWIGTFVVEGLLLYWLVLNAVRSLATLRKVVWALVLTAAVLATLSIFQEATGRRAQQFGGLAQRNLERVDANPGTPGQPQRVTIADRAAGPIGDPNRYAQMLLVVLPLALLQVRGAHGRKLRTLAAGASLLIAAGVLLTYSRGGVLGAGLLLCAAIAWGDVRWRTALAGGAVAAVLALALAPGMLARVQSIGSVQGVLKDQPGTRSDGAIKGRLTEMAAAAYVFTDHPWVGVGPGHFTPYYSVDYMSTPEIAFRQIQQPRRAHNLYLELAAETGLLGLVAFLGGAAAALRGLRRVRAFWRRLDPERAQLAAGLAYAIVAYLATGLFLQLSYQRYYWFILGLAGATVKILKPPSVAVTGSRATPAVEPLRKALV